MTPIPVIEGQALAKTFRLRSRTVHAVQNVSLAVHAGEALGIVGESGCGKTTTARLLLRLEEPTAGRIRFLGEDITDRHGAALLHYRSRAQLVFQNPFDALNPRFTIRRSLAEPLRNFGIPREEHAERIDSGQSHDQQETAEPDQQSQARTEEHSVRPTRTRRTDLTRQHRYPC